MQTAKDFYSEAVEQIKKQDFGSAKSLLEKSLATEQTAAAWHNLGVIHYLHGQNDKAVAALQSAVSVDPAYHQSYGNLARIMRETGNKAAALLYCAKAMEAAPAEISYKEDFIQITQGLYLKVFDPVFKNMVQSCLEEKGVNHQELVYAWLSVLENDPALNPVYKLTKSKNYKAFAKEMDKLKNPAALSDPFFLLGLKRFMVPELFFEDFVKYLRRYCLENPGFRSGLAGGKALLAALAEYCFYVDYIFDTDLEEEQKFAELKAQIESGQAHDACAVALAGCYMPLFSFANAAELSRSHGEDEALAPIVACLIDEPLQEKDLRGTIPAIKPIESETAKNVREQYEEFPYPRWKSLTKTFAHDDFIRQQRGETPSILNAGCGTGQDILGRAAAMQGARVLAVDLSLTSLSYAKRKAQENGIENVEFKQGDLHDLGLLTQKFDVIICTGVLVCVDDPLKAWGILKNLLKPGGLMYIGLYSEAARHGVVAARKIIAEKGYSADVQGMKAFRRDCHKLMKKKDLKSITKFRDFYTLAQCRDLLFHVLELRFTIPQIKDMLGKLGLEFVSFNLRDSVQADYRRMFPDDPGMVNLDHWAKFEDKYPDTFREMYQFWCRKP